MNLSDLIPMPPNEGPPLPEVLHIFWPWYKAAPTPPPGATLSSISITPALPTLPPGSTQQLMATATYSDGSTADVTRAAIWDSDNTAIATVNSSGLLAGVAPGSANITATLSGVSASIPVTIEGGVNYAASITFTMPTMALASGQTYKAIATVVNNSTGKTSGQPAGASLSVLALGNFFAQPDSLQGVTTVKTTPQSYAFGPGESHDFDISLTIPVGTIGVDGSSVTAAVVDPNGNALDSQTIQVTATPQVTIGLLNPPAPPAGTQWDSWTVQLVYDESISVKSTGYSGSGLVAGPSESGDISTVLTIQYPGRLTPDQIAGNERSGAQVAITSVYYRIILVTPAGRVHGVPIDIIESWWSNRPEDSAGTQTITSPYTDQKEIRTIVKVSGAFPTSGNWNWDCAAKKFVPA